MKPVLMDAGIFEHERHGWEIAMNNILLSFGPFEWILIGGLVGLSAYFFYYCYRLDGGGMLRRTFILIFCLSFIIALFFCGDRDWCAKRSVISYGAINPFVTATLSPESNRDMPQFSRVSANQNDIFRDVSSSKSEKRTENDSVQNVAYPFLQSSDKQRELRGAVSTELTTSVNANADPIRQASFQTQSFPSTSPEFSSVDSSGAKFAFSKLSQEEIAQGLEVAKLATVQIEAKIRKFGNKGPREVEETGSGFIIMTRPGNFYVITNNHVAGNPVSNEQVNIILNDRRKIHPKRVVSSVEFDLAVLELDKRDILPESLQTADVQSLNNLFHSSESALSWNPATLGNSDQVAVSESVWVIGCPFGLEGTVTSGIISGLDRHGINLGTDNQIQGFIQTDASVNPGNSGGPLINARGEVIGVMIAIASKTGESAGVSFAIPINNAIHVAEQLIRDGSYQHPYIGLRLDRLFDPAQKIERGILLDLPSIAGSAKRAAGTRVSSVVPGSPAAVAGLREGDIILRYNNKTIEDEQHFEYMISLSKINEMPKIEILRDGRHYVVAPKLTDKNLMKVQNVSIEKDY